MGKGMIACKGLKLAARATSELFVVSGESGSSKDSRQPRLDVTARRLGVPIISADELRHLRPDTVLSLEFPKKIIFSGLDPSSFVNLHFSLLPAYRGVYTAIFPILKGETHSGVTLHLMDESLDTGAILAQRKFALRPDETSYSLHMRHHQEGVKLLTKYFPRLLRGNLPRKHQQNIRAEYYSRKSIDLSNTEIPFDRGAEFAERFSRALYFPDFQTSTFHGMQVDKIKVTEVFSNFPAGTVLKRVDSKVIVATSDRNVVLYLK